MKTAISISDVTFARVERQAQQLGLSRSEFFSRAAVRYLDALDAETLTEQIDHALQTAGGDEVLEDAVQVGRAQLATTEW